MKQGREKKFFATRNALVKHDSPIALSSSIEVKTENIKALTLTIKKLRPWLKFLKRR
jgi:hypothetical protein